MAEFWTDQPQAAASAGENRAPKPPRPPLPRGTWLVALLGIALGYFALYFTLSPDQRSQTRWWSARAALLGGPARDLQVALAPAAQGDLSAALQELLAEEKQLLTQKNDLDAKLAQSRANLLEINDQESQKIAGYEREIERLSGFEATATRMIADTEARFAASASSNTPFGRSLTLFKDTVKATTPISDPDQPDHLSPKPPEKATEEQLTSSVLKVLGTLGGELDSAPYREDPEVRAAIKRINDLRRDWQ